MNNTIVMTASSIAVSEMKSNRKYLSVSMRMFSTRPNLNRCAVTEAFIDEIIANKSDYICMGLYADVPKLKKKDYRGLTHLYDQKTGTFMADEIGGFYDFEKVADEFGVSLIGYARVNKRSKLVCEAIEELYNMNALNFSFEISAGVVDVVDGITIVDANEQNELTGMAVVSVPAYPESTALELVAELKDIDRFYANANMQISEIDIETVRRVFHKALYEMLGDRCYSLGVLLFCHDCVILYDYDNGGNYKVEYLMDGNDLVIKDFYEIDFVRSGGIKNDMEELKNYVDSEVEVEETVEIAEAETEVTVAEETVEVAEEVVAEETEVAEAVETAEEAIEAEAQTEIETAEEMNVETAEEIEEHDDDKHDIDDDDDRDELAELRAENEQLKAELETLRQFKAELDEIRESERQASIKAEKDSLRKYAENEGLDTENAVIAEAIESMDYKTLMSEAMANKTESMKEAKSESYFAGYTDMKTDRFAYLLERR